MDDIGPCSLFIFDNHSKSKKYPPSEPLTVYSQREKQYKSARADPLTLQPKTPTYFLINPG